MSWSDFPYFMYSAMFFWMVGLIFLYAIKGSAKQTAVSIYLISAGIASLGLFIVLYWIAVDRPPMRTLGETRLWYSFLIPLVAMLYYSQWKQKWMLLYSLSMGTVFLLITNFKPETYTKTLMPALQSPWFIPHVIVYMFAYAIFGVSSLVAIKGMYQFYKSNFEIEVMKLADSLVYTGFAFLSMGLLFGALWAKEAWGHYWTWDPKETWALLTWLAYMLYLHLRVMQPKRYKQHLLLLAMSFVVLLICWFGINYLSTGANSVHTYSS